MITNGDIVRNMDNQNLAEIFCTLISHQTNKINIDKVTEEWYNDNVIKGIKEWLDEPYYDLKGDTNE